MFHSSLINNNNKKGIELLREVVTPNFPDDLWNVVDRTYSNNTET